MVTETRPRPTRIAGIDVLNEANECTTDRPLDTKPLSAENAFAYWQKDIPEQYWHLDGVQLADNAAARRAVPAR